MTEAKRLPGRIVIVAFVALLVIAIAGAYIIKKSNESLIVLEVLGDVPQFAFTNQSGQPFGYDDFRGKISVIDFIFTRCPGVCPVMADKMGDLYRRLERYENIQFISVTVDPDYDSLHVLREYAEAQGVNDDRWVFLRGPIEDVVALAEGGLKLPMGNLPAGHSSRFVLIDSKAQIRGYYNSQDDEGPLELQQHLRALSGALK